MAVTVRLPGTALAAALDAVRFAVGADPELPVLTGVLFDLDGATLRLVATDRYRMALAWADAVVTGALDLARLIELETRVNQTPMSEFRADGLIIATPTGSTAYNLGAGGPILDPALSALIVTPICPQAANQQRPIVLSDDCVVEVRIHARQVGSVTLDGQVGFRLEGGEGIRVTRSHHPSRFLRLRGYDYFATLRSKLQWGSQ